MLYRIFVILILFIFIGCGKQDNKNITGEKHTEDQVIRTISKDLNFIDLDDNKIKLSEFKDKIIVINFWASWVVGIRNEIMNMNKIYNEFKNTKVKVLSVSLDDVYSKEFQDYVQTLNMDLKIYSVPHDFEIVKVFPEIKEKIPSTFIIDSKYNLIKYYKGSIENTELKKVLLEMLNEK
jgi:peroxiredoxin